MADCLKSQRLNDYFAIQQEPTPTPTFCPPTIPDSSVVKVVVEKVFQECLDVECLTQELPLTDLVCPLGTAFTSIVKAEILDINITATIIAPGLVSLTKLITVQITYLCDSTTQTKDIVISTTHVIPLAQAQPGPGAELKTLVKVEFLGFDITAGILTVFVGVFVAIKFTRLVDLCINGVLQPTKPPSCVGANPCDTFLVDSHLDAIWNELQGIGQDP